MNNSQTFLPSHELCKPPQFSQLVTPYKQRELSGSNWGTSIAKDTSCQVPFSTNLIYHKWGISQVSNVQALFQAEKENLGSQSEVSPFQNEMSSNSKHQNISTINVEFPEQTISNEQ